MVGSKECKEEQLDLAGHQISLGVPGSEHYKEFRTKQVAMEHFREMLGRYSNSETVSEPDCTHLRHLLQRHPDAPEKIGTGIKRFFRDQTAYPTDCFWLERKDGTTIHFSYNKCLGPRT
jgi:hypothetical protein